ncbi:hypothetical protein E7T06_18305 [Deinococcus sp. Arct2-2]|uniref:hypothetical protein n=1 Tax=Deinococcus sp. Arct2-2 TaxID=2568653 RepID=UPI0010A38403|nr:hypothetical protein [Deinococcus sp. Arct2-2]THF68067.1 hypothetical protein E7T06_18305 [Deinococcus sp. Arct2-2]
MKSPLLSLVVALAAGSAAAAGTPAGTPISNIATASFIDPNDGTTPKTSQSNIVTTTVLPKPGFDVNFSGTTVDGNTPVAPVTGATSGAGYYPADYMKKDVVPTTAGTNVDTKYTLVNTGNNINPVSLVADVSGKTATGIALTGPALPTVEYYLDLNGNGVIEPGDTQLTGPVSIPVDDPLTPGDEGKVTIIQRIKIPTLAPKGSEYFVSPQGTGQQYITATSTTDPAYVEPSTDLQYTYIKIANPSVDIVPPADTDPSTPTITPPVPGTVPGTGGPVTDPNTYVPPANPPGGPATTPGTIVAIDPATGDQTAYPPADTNPAPDVVTFVSQVTNNGTIPDAVVLIPPTGLPPGTIVTLLDGNGNPITPDANGNFPLGVIAPGGSVPFRVIVTYPDPDGGTTPIPSIPVIIGVDSGNDPDLTPNTSGTFTVNPPNVIFGDTNGSTATPTNFPNETVVPGTPTGTGTAQTDSSAVFPMSIVNTGAYPESYTIAGSVTIKVINPNTGVISDQVISVMYYLADVNGNPTGPALTTTSVVAPGVQLKLVAVINVPINAASTNANGVNTPLLISQALAGTFSGIARSDNNDTLTISVVNSGPSGIEIAKTQTSANSNALPGNDIQYQIVAKNNFNAQVRGFFLTEQGGVVGTGTNTGTTSNMFTYSTYKSVAASTNFAGNLLVRFNSAAWQPLAAATAPATVTRVDVGVDNNAGTPDGAITAADTMPSTGVITVNFTTTIK